MFKSEPLHIVEDSDFRALSIAKDKFNRKYVKEVLFKLVEIVEVRIVAAISGNVGDIMFDGWSRQGTHYVGLFVIFMRKVDFLYRRHQAVKEELCMPLLSVCPMATAVFDTDESLNEEQTVNFTEAVDFSAKAHVEHFKSVFLSFYSIDLPEWVVCAIANNCSTNHAIGRLLNVPFIGYRSHKLNLQVEQMV